MKNVKTALAAYLEEAYFQPLAVEKRHGIDVQRQEAVIEDVRNFLDALPEYLEIEDCQYEAVLRWIDADLGHVGSPFSFSREREISMLTYINSCDASRRR